MRSGEANDDLPDPERHETATDAPFRGDCRSYLQSKKDRGGQPDAARCPGEHQGVAGGGVIERNRRQRRARRQRAAVAIRFREQRLHIASGEWCRKRQQDQCHEPNGTQSRQHRRVVQSKTEANQRATWTSTRQKAGRFCGRCIHEHGAVAPRTTVMSATRGSRYLCVADGDALWSPRWRTPPHRGDGLATSGVYDDTSVRSRHAPTILELFQPTCA